MLELTWIEARRATKENRPLTRPCLVPVTEIQMHTTQLKS